MAKLAPKRRQILRALNDLGCHATAEQIAKRADLDLQFVSRTLPRIGNSPYWELRGHAEGAEVYWTLRVTMAFVEF